MSFFDDLGGFIGSASGAVDNLAHGIDSFHNLQNAVSHGAFGHSIPLVPHVTTAAQGPPTSAPSNVLPVLLAVGAVVYLVTRK